MRTRAALTLIAAVLAAPSLAGAAPRLEERAAVRADLLVKPTGPIAVEYRVVGEPVVGSPLEIDVTARVLGAVGSLAIEANSSAPRSVLVTPPVFVTAGGGVYAWRITVVPLAAEAGYLSVIVAGSVEGLSQASTITVPLRSAAAPEEPAPAAGRAAGETLIALPVHESP